jgi:hypothetical protein
MKALVLLAARPFWLRMLAVCIATTLAGLPALAQSGASCGEAAPLQALLSEVRSLRIELLLQKIERTQSGIVELQSQLQRSEADLKHIGQQQHSQSEEIAELQQLLNQPAISQEERSQLEANRSQIMTDGAARLKERASVSARRSSELREQLGRQQRLNQQLLETLRELAGKVPGA